MSSLRNAVQRRNHRERAQPVERAKWGLLEKRKDYKLRAADHNLKKRKLNALKQKAAERNEDEFYFAMMSSTSKGGIRSSKRRAENSGGGGKSLSMEVVQLMKTQDQGYLQTALQRTKKERERVEEDVLLGENGVNSLSKSKGRVVFGDSVSSEDLFGPQKNQELGGIDEFEDFDSGQLTSNKILDENNETSEEESENLTPDQRTARQRNQHTLDVKRRKLEALKIQEQELSIALREVEQQRAKMNGTIGGLNKNGTKFKARQRKR